MAKFFADVTKTIEPQVASVQGLIQGQQAVANAQAASYKANADIMGMFVETGQAIYDAYELDKVKDVGEEARLLADRFRESYEISQKAGQDAAVLMDKYNYGQGSPLAEETFRMASQKATEKEASKNISAFNDSINMLKQRAEQRVMSNSEYLRSVQMLARQAIAQMPAQADAIRKSVSRATGIESPDEAVNRAFITEQFSKSKGSDPLAPDKLRHETIKSMVSAGFGTEEDLYALSVNSPTAWASKKQQFEEFQSAKVAKETMENNISSEKMVSTDMFRKRRVAFEGILDANLAEGVMKVAATKDNIFQKASQLVVDGKVDSLDFKTLVDQHGVAMLSSITQAETASLNAIDEYVRNNPTIDQDAIDNMRKAVQDKAERHKLLYSDKSGVGLRALANVFQNHADKSFDQKVKLADFGIKLMSVMPNSLVEKWFSGDRSTIIEDPNYAPFVKYMNKIEGLVSNNTNLDTGSAFLSAQQLKTHIDSASSTGEPIVVYDPNSPTFDLGGAPTSTTEIVNPALNPIPDKEVAKVATLVVQKKALDIIQTKDGITGTDLNLVKAMLGNSTANGAGTRVLREQFDTLKSSLQSKLNTGEMQSLREAVQASSFDGFNKVLTIKDAINAKYGVNLSVGLDEGSLSPRLILNYASQEPTPEGLPAEATMASERDKKAMEEFAKKVTPLMQGLVYGRAMVTDESPMDVAREYALNLNAGVQITDFSRSDTSINQAETAKLARQGNEYAPIIEQGLKLRQMMGEPKPITPEAMANSTNTATTATQSSEYYMTPDEAFAKFKTPEIVQKAILETASGVERGDPVKFADRFRRLSKEEQDQVIKQIQAENKQRQSKK